MFKKYTWLLCLMTRVAIDAKSPEILKDSSFLRMLNRHHSGVHSPRTQWSYHTQEDFYRRQPQGISHGYAYDSTLRGTETSSELPGYSLSSQEYWRPSSGNSNFTSSNYYSYAGNLLGSTIVADGISYQDSKQGSHSMYQYQQMRPTVVKKTPAYYLQGELQLQSFDATGKSKYKKTALHQTAGGHKKNVYPRVHKPYVKHKYPTRKIIHPLYKNYYQSPYQRYAIPSREMMRYKLQAQGEGYYKASTASPSPASVTQRYHTTERMDDAYPEGSSPSEDYSTYNDTHRGSSGSYYESYEEVEKTTSEPEESLYDENTTRGYYGDRIYMSTQMPLVTGPDRAAVKNKYFIVRRTSDDDDIETIFE